MESKNFDESTRRYLEKLDDEYQELSAARQHLVESIAAIDRRLDRIAEAQRVNRALLNEDISLGAAAETQAESAPISPKETSITSSTRISWEERGPSPLGIQVFRIAFHDSETLVQSLEEVLEKSGSDWRQRQIPCGSKFVNGTRQVIYHTYSEDLARSDSQIRRQLAKDWYRLTHPTVSQMGRIEVSRTVKMIREHHSTPEERQQMLSNWGIALDTWSKLFISPN